MDTWAKGKEDAEIEKAGEHVKVIAGNMFEHFYKMIPYINDKKRMHAAAKKMSIYHLEDMIKTIETYGGSMPVINQGVKFHQAVIKAIEAL